nr:hypothetical protein [Tanacetum cinerariifolium]
MMTRDPHRESGFQVFFSCYEKMQKIETHIPGGGGDVNEQEDDLGSGFEEEKLADNNVEEGDVDDQENKSEDPF